MEVQSVKIDLDTVLYPAFIKAAADFDLKVDDTDFSKVSNQEEAQILTETTLKQLLPTFRAALETGFAKAVSTGQLAEWGAYYVAHQTHKERPTH